MTSTWRWSGAHRFEHEAQPEHVAEGGHETRPQQAKLEAEDRTRDDAESESHAKDAGPVRSVPREVQRGACGVEVFGGGSGMAEVFWGTAEESAPVPTCRHGCPSSRR